MNSRLIHDTLACGRPFRTLNVMDGASQQALAIEADTSLSAHRVVRVLEELRILHGAPQALRLDNGPEFRSLALEEWSRKHGVELHFTQPGKPTQNAHIESFNAKLRDECLNQEWFTSLFHARCILAIWKEDYKPCAPTAHLITKRPKNGHNHKPNSLLLSEDSLGSRSVFVTC